MLNPTRRDFLVAAAAAPLLHALQSEVRSPKSEVKTSDLGPRTSDDEVRQSARRPTRIRTITAGVTLKALDDPSPVEESLDFLDRARRAFQDGGYEVQTRRVTIAWLPPEAPATGTGGSLARIRVLDQLVDSRGALMNLGAVNRAADSDRLPDWIAELFRTTKRVNCSLDVADAKQGVRDGDVAVAARIIRGLASAVPNGLANFRFAAAANVPAGTPFFPVSRHAGAPSFAIGVESAGLVGEALSGARDTRTARERLTASFNEELAGVERIATQIAVPEGRTYLGIDSSPAPGMDRSIGRAIESFTHVPFGHASTLAACAAITDVLKRLAVKTCGYCGLMLPVLEDPVLAARAREGAYGVQDLLLYSSVCGTGLDVVPLAGHTPEERLAAIIRDVAALSVKWQKPLSARLLPVPGASVGGPVHFDDPLLTDCIAMRLD